MNQTILVIDFGGQYKELISRRVRELKVYSVIRHCSVTAAEVAALAPIGIIFTGGPDSVYRDGSPACDPEILKLGIPILGICYGFQYLCHTLGGKVTHCETSEYGVTPTRLDVESRLFCGLNGQENTLMSHTDKAVKLPAGFRVTASTEATEIAAYENEAGKFYGVQFHPEVERTKCGKKLFRNFLYGICGAHGDYSIDDYLEEQVIKIREKVGSSRVVLGLSGGVDSSVCAALLSKAIPSQTICIFVDHGFMRKDEGDQIEEIFSKKAINFVRINAKDRFLSALKGVTEPETKRKTIGKLFVDVFREEAKKYNAEFLAQGTIYPDVIESGANNSANIKSHHNVGGLPKDLGFKDLVEPLRGLFKDEVRVLGKKLGLPLSLINRQPFPGPGLAVRIVGEITEDKLSLLQRADAIFREEMLSHKVKADQYFAVLTGNRSVGVMGDYRTYCYTCALRAVATSDFMTCEYVRIPYKVLDKVSLRITNEVEGINRIVYDITGKPPATIEWE